MIYSIQTICTAIEGKFILQSADDGIEHLIYDSRRIQQPSTSVFFALRTEHNDGHKFIADAYKKGIRNFIISEQMQVDALANCNVVLVEDVLDALQKRAAFH